VPSAVGLFSFALFQQIHLFFEMLKGSYTRHGIEVAGCRPGFIPVTPDNTDIFDGTGTPTGVGFDQDHGEANSSWSQGPLVDHSLKVILRLQGLSLLATILCQLIWYHDTPSRGSHILQ
jgi:hypothetical protein